MSRRNGQTGSVSYAGKTPKNEIRLDTFTAYGSTNNKIVQFTNSSVTGTALTLTVNDGTSGAAITVNQNGVYAVSCSIECAASGRPVSCVSINSASLTTAATSLTNAERLTISVAPVVVADSGYPNAAWTGYLSRGDVLRAHTNGTTPATAANAIFVVSMIAES